MGVEEIRAYLTHLVMERNVAASTQNQALHSNLFLYKQVLEIQLPHLGALPVAKKQPRLPVVFTREEAQAILAKLSGEKWLMASLLYGAGLRLMECLRLRIKDLDFDRNIITIREGKGGKDRVTMLPNNLKEPLQTHLAGVRQKHKEELAEGVGTVKLPFALASKYPNAPTQWKWQFVFPAPKRSCDPRTGLWHRINHVIYLSCLFAAQSRLQLRSDGLKGWLQLVEPRHKSLIRGQLGEKFPPIVADKFVHRLFFVSPLQMGEPVDRDQFLIGDPSGLRIVAVPLKTCAPPVIVHLTGKRIQLNQLKGYFHRSNSTRSTRLVCQFNP